MGLPDDPLQSEMAKKKFQTSVTLLSKAMPSMTEARAVIKSGESKAPKKRYQVQVFIGSSDSHHSFEVSNYQSLQRRLKKSKRGSRNWQCRRGEKGKKASDEKPVGKYSSLH